ncbi:LOW QUALITY PROTEIN: hypothetical protein IFM47457_08045 [Aspergillus lentulus]|nr:LOW QUALITY PROTEIN: hypothetical protein IFM47457_08045 [Aspergillus lentulus]
MAPGTDLGKLGLRWPQEPAEGYSTAMAVCGRSPRHCEQRVSIFLEPDSEQGTLCVTAMMFNICALSGGWVNVDGGHGSLPTW